MCGLVGIAGDLSHRHLSVFKDLLRFDTVRGPHSTGVAAVDLDGEIHIKKNTLNGFDFVEETKSLGTIVTYNRHILMGHNRHATVGKVNNNNAHPFEVDGKFVGAHNGTLKEHLCKGFIKDFDDFGTDSEAALTSMFRRGAKETLENISGAWAFVYYNSEDRTLNFTRNDKRPLFVATKKDNLDVIMWASESWMLKCAMGRNGIAPSEFDFFEIEPCTIISWKMPDTLRGSFGLPKKTLYKEKEVVSQPNFSRSGAYMGYTYRNSRQTHGQSSTNKAGKDTTKPTTHLALVPRETSVDLVGWNNLARIEKILESKDHHRDENGVYLPSKHHRASYVGNTDCVICGSKIEPESGWKLFPHKTFVCEDCAEDGTAAQILYEGGVVA